MNKGLTVLWLMTKNFHFWVNYPFKDSNNNEIANVLSLIVYYFKIKVYLSHLESIHLHLNRTTDVSEKWPAAEVIYSL